MQAIAFGERGVIAHQSPGFVASPASYRTRVASHAVWGFAAVQRTQAGDSLVSGMRGLLLPDVFVKGLGSEEGARVVSEAAIALAELGRVPAIGARLGSSVVAAADEQWVRVEPG